MAIGVQRPESAHQRDDSEAAGRNAARRHERRLCVRPRRHPGRKNPQREKTQYIIDKNRPYAQVLEERNAIGNLLASYVHGKDLLSQQRPLASSGTSIKYYLYDGFGSVRALSDANGSVTDSYVYDGYGMALDSTGTHANPYRYRGEQYDAELQAYYLRARYYQEGIERFMTTDPFEGFTIHPISLHEYLYANGNPVNYRDPSGNMSLLETLQVVGTLGVLSGLSGCATHPHIATHSLCDYKTGSLRVISAGIRVSKGRIGHAVKFEFEINPGSAPENCNLVNWVKGNATRHGKVIHGFHTWYGDDGQNSTTEGRWMVDSDVDNPRYAFGSGGIRYTESGGWATDFPSFPVSWKNVVMNWDCKICIYNDIELPNSVSVHMINGNPIGTISTRPIACVKWEAKFSGRTK